MEVCGECDGSGEVVRRGRPRDSRKKYPKRVNLHYEELEFYQDLIDSGKKCWSEFVRAQLTSENVARFIDGKKSKKEVR